jgi:LPXTG-site transpeptidase (sortase) family protein
VFALLDNLEDGDDIIVFYNQKRYTYKVTDRATVKPGDVKVLESRDPSKKELSLMTCWPVGTTLERLIIFAELQE